MQNNQFKKFIFAMAYSGNINSKWQMVRQTVAKDRTKSVNQGAWLTWSKSRFNGWKLGCKMWEKRREAKAQSQMSHFIRLMARKAPKFKFYSYNFSWLPCLGKEDKPALLRICAVVFKYTLHKIDSNLCQAQINFEASF